MIKRGILILLFLLPFPSVSFSAWPGECTLKKTSCSDVSWTSVVVETSSIGYILPPTVDPSNGMVSAIGDNTYTVNVGDTIYRPLSTCVFQSYYWEDNKWNFVNGRSITYSSNRFSANCSDGCGWETTFPDGCPEPDPCQDEWNALVARCGGEEYIGVWVGETGQPPLECFGDCICPPGDQQQIEDYCADKGGWSLSGTSYDTERCQPKCDGCQGVDPGYCPNGVWYFDNVTCQNVCRNCNTEYQDCMNNCGGNIAQYDCSDSPASYPGSESLISVCYCVDEDDPFAPPDEDIPPDGPPDIDEPPPAAPDATNNPDPPEAGEEAPDGDGTNDNELLANIAENIRRAVDNTATLGNIMQTELDLLNATNQNIYNRLDATNQWLRNIESGTRQGNALLKGTNQRLGNIYAAVDGIEGGLGQLGEKLDGIDEKLDAEFDPDSLGPSNQYDASVPEELEGYIPSDEYLNICDLVIDWLAENVGFISTIQESSVILENATPCVTGSVMGAEMVFCFDTFESIFIAMGWMLYGLSWLQAFFILIRG